MFKCLNQITPENFHKWFKLNHERHSHRTRSNFNTTDSIAINNLFIPAARTSNYGLKQLKVNGPRIWNALPPNLKNVNSLNVFLRRLKVHYISEYLTAS